MAEKAGSSVTESAENDPMADFKFKPLAREEYYLEDVFALYFQLPDPDRCPSYLDVIRIAPLLESREPKKNAALHELTFSYCRWNIENGDGQFSVRVNVQDIVATNENFSRAEDGIIYVAQYIASPKNEVIAETTPFRIFPVLEESTMNLPEVFSDDGLIVLGSGSDSEPELLDDEPVKEEPEEKTEKSYRGDEELTIVMSESELRRMENENRASNEKLRSFIDQYKNDLLELTKRNEILKHKLYDEQSRVANLEKTQGEMSTELMELRGAKLRVEAILKETITERERKLREEQNRVFKLEEEVSLLNGQVENLRCCVDAHLETKNLLMAEMDSLRVKQEPIRKNLSDKSTSTPWIQEPVASRDSRDSGNDEDVLVLEETRKKLNEEIARLQRAKRKLWRDVVRMKSEVFPSEQSTDASDVGESFKVSGQQNTDLEDRVQDLTKRLQEAKLEYISLYKENKRKEKALENICNWASLAKDGMSLEAPEPSQVPSLMSLTSSKFTSSFDELLPKIMSNASASSALNDRVPKESFSGFLGVKPRTSGLESLEDDLVQLGSDSKLPLPPRQKRKYDLLRKSSATVAAGIASTAVSRAMQRGKMVVRGRHRAYEPVRFPLKRETPSPGKEVLDYTPSCLLPAAVPSKPAPSARSRVIFKKKEAPKPSAPEATSVDESAQDDSAPSAAPAPRIPRGTNTYSAAGLISDLETDASNTEEEPSISNPNICPLCVTSILDYEAHMREAHQKQPCPICGYVFDTNIPLYVMTYHIERHLEDVEENPWTQ